MVSVSVSKAIKIKPQANGLQKVKKYYILQYYAQKRTNLHLITVLRHAEITNLVKS